MARGPGVFPALAISTGRAFPGAPSRLPESIVPQPQNMADLALRITDDTDTSE